jgi:hypothetical protein
MLASKHVNIVLVNVVYVQMISRVWKNVFNFAVTAQIYVLSSQYMSRNSEFSNKICGQCADIYEACAVECDKFDMDMCKQCAQVCHACASVCRKMAL